MTKLKNCPHCGGDAGCDSSDGTHWIFCRDIECLAPDENKEAVFKSWNQRTHTKEDASLIEIGRLNIKIRLLAVTCDWSDFGRLHGDISGLIYEHIKEFGE